jgi:hypothetical protein
VLLLLKPRFGSQQEKKRKDQPLTISPMYVTPENAEAAPKDGLVTPSTTWWMRWLNLNMAGQGVNF